MASNWYAIQELSVFQDVIHMVIQDTIMPTVTRIQSRVSQNTKGVLFEMIIFLL